MNLALSPLDAWLQARTGISALSSAQLEAWQMAELRRTLAWARQASPLYAARLAGLDLSALRSHADLALLPPMDAAHLDAPGLLAVSQDEVARAVRLATSGSSAAPKRLHFSQADLLRTQDFFRVGMATLCREGDTALVLLPGRKPWGVCDLLLRALPDIGVQALAAPEAPEAWTPQDIPGIIAAHGVTVLVAAPTQLRALLALPPQPFAPLRALLSSAEPLPEALRTGIEQAWNCEVFDHWGMTETGYGAGVECSAHSGYHLREADLLLEIADPATGAPLPTGETGEILLTTLGERAMPLVRYKTGDAGRLLPPPCPCGSPLRRLDRVRGRLAPDGRGILETPKNWTGWRLE